MSSNRGIYHNFISQDACQQLLFIHRALGVVGYRPKVRSTTLFDLISAEPRLLPSVVHVRQQVLDAIEEHFDKPCQVFVEHTGLISWSAGASIGWHFDANRDYLAQRHFSAVLYLTTQDVDFTGGTFCFQSGSQPLHIQPVAGTLLMYTADQANVHQVEPVTSGDRATLTMWFTLDEAYQEDKKVLASLTSPAMCAAGLPATMYRLLQQSPDAQDIRLAELRKLGVQLANHTQCNTADIQSQHQLQYLHAGRIQQQPWVSEPAWAIGTADGGFVMEFGSIQDAAMTLYMLQWKLCHHKQPHLTELATAADGASSFDHHNNAPAAPGRSQTRQTQQEQKQHHQQQESWKQQPDRHLCGCYTDNKQLARARQLLQEYLHAAGEKYEQLLPVWLKLGALVAPQSADAHHEAALACTASSLYDTLE